MAPAEVASWGALVAYMGATFAPVPGAAEERYVYERGETRCEVAIAQVLAPPGRPWACLWVTLGPMEPFVLRAMLVANAELPVGALALMDDKVVLRQTLPLEGLLVTHLEQAITALAEIAAALQPAAAGGASPYAYVLR